MTDETLQTNAGQENSAHSYENSEDTPLAPENQNFGPTNWGQDSEQEIARLKEALARATADYQNLLKRSETERLEMSEYFTESFAKKLLPTLDNLERVVSGTPEELRTGAVYEWVKHAASGLSKMLESIGITSFESVGTELDPMFHEALSQCPGPAGVIMTEFEKWYKLNKKVVRHAKVIVGNGEETPI